MRLLLGLATSLLLAHAAMAEIYKWKDENGVTHYGDKPSVANAKPVELPPLQYYGEVDRGKSKKGSASKPFQGTGPAPYGGSGPKIEITQPAPDATLPVGKFTVLVAANLASGQTLNYYLDGEVQNQLPTVSTAFLYAGAEKGDHMIQAAVLDSSGREVSRSEPVIVHLQGPQAATPTASAETGAKP